MRNIKAKSIIRIAVAAAAVVLLISLAANEARPGSTRGEQTQEHTPIGADANTSDTVLPENLAVNDQVNSEQAGEAILGAAYTTQPGNYATGLTDRYVSTDSEIEEKTVEEIDERTGETSGEQGDEQPTELPTELPEQPDTTVSVNSSNQGGLKTAYITIDDGPSRNITPGILDLLALEGVKATFFVLPHDGVRDLYQRILDEGHEIGNHSYSHVYSRLYNSDDLEVFREDVIKARDYIYDNFGYLTTIFRFPGGMMGRSSSIVTPRREILEELGYRYFDWNIDTGDANSRQTDKSADALTDNVLRNTQGREKIVVLMHDTGDKQTTLEALPLIIAGLREQGYVFDILRNYDIQNPGAATQTSLPA